MLFVPIVAKGTILLLVAAFINFLNLVFAGTQDQDFKSEKLEVHCIEEYGKYCNGKYAGFKFSDGCRICKCAENSVVCKKGDCQFFAKINEDALDYCDSVLLKNAEAYAAFKKTKSKQVNVFSKPNSNQVNMDKKSRHQPKSEMEKNKFVINGVKNIDKEKKPKSDKQMIGKIPHLGNSRIHKDTISPPKIKQLVTLNDYKEEFGGQLNNNKGQKLSFNKVPNIRVANKDALKPIPASHLKKEKDLNSENQWTIKKYSQPEKHTRSDEIGKVQNNAKLLHSLANKKETNYKLFNNDRTMELHKITSKDVLPVLKQAPVVKAVNGHSKYSNSAPIKHVEYPFRSFSLLDNQAIRPVLKNRKEIVNIGYLKDSLKSGLHDLRQKAIIPIGKPFKAFGNQQPKHDAFMLRKPFVNENRMNKINFNKKLLPEANYQRRINRLPEKLKLDSSKNDYYKHISTLRSPEMQIKLQENWHTTEDQFGNTFIELPSSDLNRLRHMAGFVSERRYIPQNIHPFTRPTKNMPMTYFEIPPPPLPMWQPIQNNWVNGGNRRSCMPSGICLDFPAQFFPDYRQPSNMYYQTHSLGYPWLNQPKEYAQVESPYGKFEPLVYNGMLNMGSGSSEKVKQIKSTDKIKMSDKIKALLELTKAALHLLIRANYSGVQTNESYLSGSTSLPELIFLPTTTPIPENRTQEIASTVLWSEEVFENKTNQNVTIEDEGIKSRREKLHRIVKIMQRIVPDVQKYVKKEEKEEEEMIMAEKELDRAIVAKDLRDQSNKTFSLKEQSTISEYNIGSSDNNTGNFKVNKNTLSLEGSEIGEKTDYKIQLRNCKLYTDKLIKALESKNDLEQLDSNSKSDPTKSRLKSILSLIKQIL